MGYIKEDRKWIWEMKSNRNNFLKSYPKPYKNCSNKFYKKGEMRNKTEIKVS